MKRRKTSELSRLKKELEALQKLVVIKIYGNDCFTCEAKNLKGKNCQLGHVPWPRSILSQKSIYNYKLTRIQCMACNIHRGGMGAFALLKMQNDGTPLDELWQRNLDSKGIPVKLDWYRARIDDYKQLLGLT